MYNDRTQGGNTFVLTDALDPSHNTMSAPLGQRTYDRVKAKTAEECGPLDDDEYNELLMATWLDGWKRLHVGRGRSGLGSKTYQYELTEQVFHDMPRIIKRLYFLLLTLPGNEDAPTVVHAVFGGGNRGTTYILSKEQEDYYLDSRPKGITPSQVNTMIHRTKTMNEACAGGADGSDCPKPSNAETLASNAYCAAMVNDAKQNPTAAVTLAEFIAYAPPIAEGCEGIYAIFGQNGEKIIRDFVRSLDMAVGDGKTISIDSDVEDDYDIYKRRIMSKRYRK